MTLEEAVGQLLWCGWGEPPEAGPRSYNQHARHLVEELGVGGLALFTRNLGTPEEISELTDLLRTRAAIPPLIGIDQEGGRVSRMPFPGMVFPGSMALGHLDDAELTRQVHRCIGEQLSAVGIDVDFAPSVDVNNNPLNPIIGVRGFSDDPSVVARHGIAAVAGLRDAGVVPVIKHFPGHGDTSQDSHLELPVQPADRARLDAVELAPFRAAISAGAPAVMTTHIMFPALDPKLPATLSRRILTGLLRDELKFDGLIVTDCLEMNGIAGHWGAEEAALLAVEAGADMLLVCHTWDTQRRMFQALIGAVRSGRISEERIRQSASRVARVRELSASVGRSSRNPGAVGAPHYRELEAELADRTLAQLGAIRRGVVPFDRRQPVLVAGAPTAAERIATALQDSGYAATALADGAPLPQDAPQLLWAVLTNDPFTGGIPDEAVHTLLARHPRAVVVAVQEPYCLAHYPVETTRVAAWSLRPAQLRALTKWLTGERGEPLMQLQDGRRC